MDVRSRRRHGATRLIHTPWWDASRATPPGALLLGRIYALKDIIAYANGITIVATIDRPKARRHESQADNGRRGIS
jgi:hypothetical protein